MERIAVIAVALSIAVMIVSVAVVLGFKSQIARRMSGLSAHVTVMAMGGDIISPRIVERDTAIERTIESIEQVRSLAAFTSRGGVMRSDSGIEGVLLKGIEGGYAGSFFEQMLIEGSLPQTDAERNKDILLSRTTARKMALGVGDKVEMIFLDHRGEARRDRFRISGIYSSGMEELEAVALTDIRNVQRLCGWQPNEISGYEIMCYEQSQSTPTARLIGEILDRDSEQLLRSTAIEQMNPGIFDWLRTHDVNAIVVIVVMMVVAIFNMITALLIIVMERTRMVGILKALGMGDRALQRIFLYRSAAIIARGVLWGNIVGCALCAIQQIWHPIKLNSEGYLLSEVPIDLGFGWWLILNIGAVAIIIVAMALPARLTINIKPDVAIRYD